MEVRSPRNIRVGFFNRLGIEGAKERSIFEKILKQPVIDVVSLSKIVARYRVPGHVRAAVWRVLLEVLPIYQDTWDYIQTQSKQKYMDIKRTALLIHYGSTRIDTPTTPRRQYKTYSQSYPNRSTMPAPDRQVASKHKAKILCLVYSTQKYLQNSQGTSDPHPSELEAIAMIFHKLFSNEWEAYWALHSFLNRLSKEYGKRGIAEYHQMDVLVDLMKTAEPELYSHFIETGVQLEHFCFRHYRSKFVRTFPEEDLLLFWDKVIGISHLYVPCIALAILHYLKSKILELVDVVSITEYLTNEGESEMEAIACMYGADDTEHDPDQPNLSSDDADDNTIQATSGVVVVHPTINAAPSVSDNIRDVAAQKGYLDVHSSTVYTNPRYDQLWAPVSGPTQLPFRSGAIAPGQRNTLTGFVEDDGVNAYSFHQELHGFMAHGQANDPDAQHNHQSIINSNIESNPNPRKRKKIKKPKSKDPIDTFIAPWENHRAEEEEEDQATKQSDKPDADGSEEEVGPPAPDQKQDDEPVRPSKKIKLIPQPFDARCEWNITPEIDYMGRTFIDPPSHLKPDLPHKCFIPKKCIHTWGGHSKGVQVIRFSPGYGHLLFSGSMDSTIKIWEVYGKRRCIATYSAHQKGVKDLNLSKSGDKLISCGYDRMVRIWDVETGKQVSAHTTGKIPYVAKFYPADENIILAGQSDKKIIQWDTRSGQIVQEYDRHLGAVNTITFIDENRRFVTTSDDKSIRVWEYGIPVDIKYIAEPHMHSMPAITLYPNGKWALCQSLDNQILVYSTKDRFRLNRKKRFFGHLIAGYACQVGISPDGRFVMSGDSDGKVWFWDWKTSKVFSKLTCHKNVVISCLWHPIEPSKVATASWDGTVKFWD